MSEPEEQPPEKKGAPPEGQRLIDSSVAVHRRQARSRSCLRETPLAIYVRKRTAAK